MLRRKHHRQVSPQLDRAFREEREAGVRLMVRIRFAVLAVIAVWLLTRIQGSAVAYYLAILGLFAALGWGQMRAAALAGFGAQLVQFALVLLDMALLALALVVPSPTTPAEWPLAMQLRLGNFEYFYVFIAFAVFSYSPAYALWSGLAALLAWSGGVAWILQQGSTFTVTDIRSFYSMDVDQVLGILLDRNYVSTVIWVQEVVVAVLMAGVLAAAVWRFRRLAFRQAELATERANLARYFSPNMVETLSRASEAFAETRTQAVAVLFVDIVGFTRLAESLPPIALMEMLRQFHGRMADAVFQHEGTVDKYIGDALMATFGTPHPGPRDASNALACARAMAASVAVWNDERQVAGQEPIRVGIGAHFGPVVLGDIGSERTLEFAVVGDTVNVASRLEGLTRALQATAVISEDLYLQADREGFEAEVLQEFEPGYPQPLRNRSEPIGILFWRLAPRPAL
jgi:adenylate cyclase